MINTSVRFERKGTEEGVRQKKDSRSIPELTNDSAGRSGVKFSKQLEEP